MAKASQDGVHIPMTWAGATQIHLPLQGTGCRPAAHPASVLKHSRDRNEKIQWLVCQPYVGPSHNNCGRFASLSQVGASACATSSPSASLFVDHVSLMFLSHLSMLCNVFFGPYTGPAPTEAKHTLEPKTHAKKNTILSFENA